MKRVLILFTGIIALISMMSCSSSRKSANIPQARPLAEKYTIAKHSMDNSEINPAYILPKDSLSMTEAIQMALLKNPELGAYSYELRAREARTLQESFAPNPEIEIEIENFAGSGELSEFKGSEFTISVGQLIELSGKRDKRTLAAVLHSDISAWDYESKKLDILTTTVKQFLQLIGDQNQISLNEELVNVSENLHKAVIRLVKAGRISAAELSRTQILLSTAKLDLNRSLRKFEADRFRLAALWGEQSAEFKSVMGTLENVAEIPPLDSLKNLLSDNPDMVRLMTEIEMRQAVESLEDARKTPDPTIQAGYRHISEPNLNAFVANFSIPLPVFDTNNGAVQEAYNHRKKVEQQRRQIEIEISTSLIEVYQHLLVLYSDIDNSKKIIIPEAEKAYNIINDGYLLGKFSFLDVLQSQKTLFEARKYLITALIEYNTHVADMERLIGRSLSTVNF